LRLRIAGWPVAGDGSADVSPTGVTATGAGLISRLHGVPVGGVAADAVVAATDAGVAVHDDAGPLGSPVRVPWLDHALRPGAWVAALVGLSGSANRHDHGTCRVTFDPVDQGSAVLIGGDERRFDEDRVDEDRVDQDPGDQAPGVRVEWPDGRSTHTRLSTRAGQGSHSGDPVAIRAL
jgi:hypothetical protein